MKDTDTSGGSVWWRSAGQASTISAAVRNSVRDRKSASRTGAVLGADIDVVVTRDGEYLAEQAGEAL